jgi:hypothetical protein
MRDKRVYFIRPIGMKGPIKIGCSFSPTGRKSSLETWSPFPLEVVAEIDGGEQLERRFHQRFIASHKHREWFDWTPELGATIEAIVDGSFDVTTLPEAIGAPCVKGQRKRWTEEQKIQLSYSLRAAGAFHRTGFKPPVEARKITPEKAAVLDRYFAEPHVYGVRVDWPWAKQRQDRWLEKRAAA